MKALLISSGVAVALIVQSVAGLFFSAGDRRSRVNRRLTMLDSGMKPDDVYAALVRNRARSPDLGSASLTTLHDQVFDYTHQAVVALLQYLKREAD